MRAFFKFLNKFFMVPMFRLGLGPFMGNPLTGYIMVMKTVGRKSGKIRYAPVNYAIQEGKVYCMAGFGHKCDWYRNLLAHPGIDMILPGGAIYGSAAEVKDQGRRSLAIRQILKNAGIVAFLDGMNPYSLTEAELESRTRDMPLLCITHAGLGNGSSDPSGWAWVGPVFATLALIIFLWFILR
jgi:deazaflavin-dependent oxidoreductase (nitroreductase family)